MMKTCVPVATERQKPRAELEILSCLTSRHMRGAVRYTSIGTIEDMVQVFVAIVLLFLPVAAFAQMEKRIALLIGNKDYKAGVGTLIKPLIRVPQSSRKRPRWRLRKTTKSFVSGPRHR